MKIKWRLHIGMATGDRKGEIEVADDATDEEIAEIVKEDAHQHIELSWERESALSGKEE